MILLITIPLQLLSHLPLDIWRRIFLSRYTPQSHTRSQDPEAATSTQVALIRKSGNRRTGSKAKSLWSMQTHGPEAQSGSRPQAVGSAVRMKSEKFPGPGTRVPSENSKSLDDCCHLHHLLGRSRSQFSAVSQFHGLHRSRRRRRRRRWQRRPIIIIICLLLPLLFFPSALLCAA